MIDELADKLEWVWIIYMSLIKNKSADKQRIYQTNRSIEVIGKILDRLFVEEQQ